MKAIIILFLLSISIYTNAQSYYKLMQDDDVKFLVSYDTLIDGKINVSYIPCESYLSSLTNELENVEQEITRMLKIIEIYNKRVETLYGKKNKLIVLKTNQEK